MKHPNGVSWEDLPTTVQDVFADIATATRINLANTKSFKIDGTHYVFANNTTNTAAGGKIVRRICADFDKDGGVNYAKAEVTWHSGEPGHRALILTWDPFQFNLPASEVDSLVAMFLSQNAVAEVAA